MPSNIRSFGIYLEKSISAIHCGIDRANSINDPYYKEGSIILIANAWELLSKALLIKHGGEQQIYEIGTNRELTITAEQSVNKLKNLGYIKDLEASSIQQVVSLRNEASHTTLPAIPDEIVFHLEYYAIRYFRELLNVNFKNYSKKFRKSFLSISFDTLITYADSVKKLITKARNKRKPKDIRLAYLLERGINFSGSEYMKQSDFDRQLFDRKVSRPLYKLKLGNYARKAEMIVVVPIQAPSGTQADIKLTKTHTGSAISVRFEKRATDDDYPYLTQDLTSKLGISRNILLYKIKDLNLKGNPIYHQKVRTGKNSFSHKYSENCFTLLKSEFGV